MTVARARPPKARPSKARPSLSRELIAATALRLTREEPNMPLTLTRLGVELAADPTAIYRHYRSREELLVDLFELTYSEVLDRFEPGGDWRSSLNHVGHAMRAALLVRPALVAEVGHRFTGGPHEQEAICVTREMFRSAGLSDHESNQQVRVFGEMILANVMMSAATMSAQPEVQLSELELAARVYGVEVSSMQTYDHDTFTMMLDTYFDGLAARVRVARRSRPSGGTT